MLKTLFSVVLNVFCLHAEAQQLQKDTGKIGNGKFFLDASIGIGKGVMADVNLGFRLNKVHAFGFSYIAFGSEPIFDRYNPAIDGVGFQYRITPKNSLFKFEVGSIRSVRKSPDTNVEYNYKADKSSGIYYRITAAYRLIDVIVLGITTVIAPNCTFDTFGGTTSTETETFSVVTFSMGVAISTNKHKK